MVFSSKHKDGRSIEDGIAKPQGRTTTGDGNASHQQGQDEVGWFGRHLGVPARRPREEVFLNVNNASLKFLIFFILGFLGKSWSAVHRTCHVRNSPLGILVFCCDHLQHGLEQG
jgi:hypothetical protein